MNSVQWKIFFLTSQHGWIFLAPFSLLPVTPNFRKSIFYFHSPYIFNTEWLLKPWHYCFEKLQMNKVTNWPPNCKPGNKVHMAEFFSFLAKFSGSSTIWWGFPFLVLFYTSELTLSHTPAFFSSPLYTVPEHLTHFHSFSYWLCISFTPSSGFSPGWCLFPITDFFFFPQ